MPILALQKRARELGRIRIGQKGAKGQPQKLDRFRMTSHSRTLIEKAASLYGGTAREWTPQGGVQQWEVITDTRRIPIMVPPQPVSQFLETWSGGGCTHRCDGETNFLTGEPCDVEDPNHQNAKPTTRLNVVLRDVEGIGVWRLESHGWNAAVELPDTAAFLAQAGGYVDGWLSLEERISKSDGQTRRYVVPTIEIDVTPAELMAGKGRVATPEVDGPVTRAAIGAGSSTPVMPNYVGQARSASTLDEVRAVWAEAAAAGHLNDDLKRALTEIGNALNPATGAPATDYDPRDEEPVDAEVVQDEPATDPDVVWQQILKAAGEQGMGLPDVEDDFAQRSGGVTSATASATELAAYLRHLQQAVSA